MNILLGLLIPFVGTTLGAAMVFLMKNKLNKTYEININKYKNGGVCGKDKKCKFAQSSRVFSQNGYAPTLTANNTSDNFKILVEED